jgi:hypothetical protein
MTPAVTFCIFYDRALATSRRDIASFTFNIARCSGFLILIHSGELPARYGRSRRFDIALRISLARSRPVRTEVRSVPSGRHASSRCRLAFLIDSRCFRIPSSVDVVITVGSNPTPTEQSQTIINNIVAANLPSSVTNSYLANLNKVGPFIQQGKTGPAINQLNAFINKVNQDYSHGTITLAQKNAFVAAAQTLISALQ